MCVNLGYTWGEHGGKWGGIWNGRVFNVSWKELEETRRELGGTYGNLGQTGGGTWEIGGNSMEFERFWELEGTWGNWVD